MHDLAKKNSSSHCSNVNHVVSLSPLFYARLGPKKYFCKRHRKLESSWILADLDAGLSFYQFYPQAIGAIAVLPPLWNKHPSRCIDVFGLMWTLYIVVFHQNWNSLGETWPDGSGDKYFPWQMTSCICVICHSPAHLGDCWYVWANLFLLQQHKNWSFFQDWHKIAELRHTN